MVPWFSKLVNFGSWWVGSCHPNLLLCPHCCWRSSCLQLGLGQACPRVAQRMESREVTAMGDTW